VCHHQGLCPAPPDVNLSVPKTHWDDLNVLPRAPWNGDGSSLTTSDAAHESMRLEVPIQFYDSTPLLRQGPPVPANYEALCSAKPSTG
jgi:hypothetical protein